MIEIIYLKWKTTARINFGTMNSNMKDVTISLIEFDGKRKIHAEVREIKLQAPKKKGLKYKSSTSSPTSKYAEKKKRKSDSRNESHHPAA